MWSYLLSIVTKVFKPKWVCLLRVMKLFMIPMVCCARYKSFKRNPQLLFLLFTPFDRRLCLNCRGSRRSRIKRAGWRVLPCSHSYHYLLQLQGDWQICAGIFFFHHCIRWSSFPWVCKNFYFIDHSLLFPFLFLPSVIRTFLLVLLTYFGLGVLIPLPLMIGSWSVLLFQWSSLVLKTLLVWSIPIVVGWRALSNSNGLVGRVFRNLNLGNMRGEGMRWVHVEFSVYLGGNKITGKIWFCNCLNEGWAKLEIIIRKASEKQHSLKISSKRKVILAISSVACFILYAFE